MDGWLAAPAIRQFNESVGRANGGLYSSYGGLGRVGGSAGASGGSGKHKHGHGHGHHHRHNKSRAPGVVKHMQHGVNDEDISSSARHTQFRQQQQEPPRERFGGPILHPRGPGLLLPTTSASLGAPIQGRQYALHQQQQQRHHQPAAAGPVHRFAPALPPVPSGPRAAPALPAPVLVSDAQSQAAARLQASRDRVAQAGALAGVVQQALDQLLVGSPEDQGPGAAAAVRLLKVRRLAGSREEEPKVTLFALVDDAGSDPVVATATTAAVNATSDEAAVNGVSPLPSALQVVVKRGLAGWWQGRIEREAEMHRLIAGRALQQGQEWRVVPFFGAHTADEASFVASPYVAGGDLRQAIRGRGVLNVPTWSRWLHDALSTLRWMHRECRVVHGDTLTGNWMTTATQVVARPYDRDADVSEDSCAMDEGEEDGALDSDNEVGEMNSSDDAAASTEEAAAGGSGDDDISADEEEEELDDAEDDDEDDDEDDGSDDEDEGDGPVSDWDDSEATARYDRCRLVLFDFDESWPLDEFVNPANFEVLCKIDLANFLADCEYELKTAGRPQELIDEVRRAHRATFGKSAPPARRLLRRLKRKVDGAQGKNPRELVMTSGKVAFM